MQHDDAGQAMQHDDAGQAMQHQDAGLVAQMDSTNDVDESKRKLLKRGKVALPVVFTLTSSNGLCVS